MRYKQATSFLSLLLLASADVSAAAVDEWLLTLDPLDVVYGTRASPRAVIAHDPVNSTASLDEVILQSDGPEVDAFHRVDGDTYYFSLDTHASFAGQTVSPSDVLLVDGGNESVFFDASAEGLSDGIDTDAIAFDDNGQLVFSIDTHAVLSGTVFDDADLIVFDGSGFAALLDASSAGFDDSADTDALATLPDGELVLSFASGNAASGQAYGDGTLIRVQADGSSLATVFDARADLSTDSDIVALDAVPAPDEIFSDRFEA